MAVTSTVTLGATLDTYAGDYDLASVTSIDADAQTSGAGEWTFGTAARAGLGSVVMRHAGLVSCLMTGWRKKSVPIEIGGVTKGDPIEVRHYDALEVDLRTEEKLEEDITDRSNPLNQVFDLAGVDVSFRREDNSEYEAASLDA